MLLFLCDLHDTIKYKMERKNEMITINKISKASAIDYAAEELRKYLKMMMPEGEDVFIEYAPDATDGFRLGMMQDFGLDVSDVPDTNLDDIIYFDCNESGGIIAGDNPRAVLLAVYEYLRAQGCRWLMPGIDGELIPVKNIQPAKLRHVPSMRYRGWASEGTVYQQGMVEAIEFMPKLGMNLFMVEFKFPKSYYERYYNHDGNKYRPAEPVSDTTVMQWKRHLEAELSKRGLLYHDMGHGFTYEPLGIPCGEGWSTDYDSKLTEEQRNLIAKINGKREIFHIPINTNLCMSNPKAREKVTSYVVEYARQHRSVNGLHVWLADAKNNHCECAECQKLRPTDFYVTLLNEIDEALSAADLDTKIVFISYMDTCWAPLENTIKNPDRFILMLAPISRRYDSSLDATKIPTELPPYVRNKLSMPPTLEDFFGHFNKWRERWHGPNISFEYHFWRAMFLRDVTGINLARVLYNDVGAYLENGINGILEDGSQRSFFPNGFAFYSYARTMFNKETPFEEILEDYYSAAYGKEWKKIYSYMQEITEAFDIGYLSKSKSKNTKISDYYNPEHAASLNKVTAICREARKTLDSFTSIEYRLRTTSLKLLKYHLTYVEMLAEAYAYKALGDDKTAREKYDTLVDTMAKAELDIQQYYDHGLCCKALATVFIKTVTHNEYMDVEEKTEKKK